MELAEIRFADSEEGSVAPRATNRVKKPPRILVPTLSHHQRRVEANLRSQVGCIQLKAAALSARILERLGTEHEVRTPDRGEVDRALDDALIISDVTDLTNRRIRRHESGQYMRTSAVDEAACYCDDIPCADLDDIPSDPGDSDDCKYLDNVLPGGCLSEARTASMETLTFGETQSRDSPSLSGGFEFTSNDSMRETREAVIVAGNVGGSLAVVRQSDPS